jgi:hypothetical protein
VASRSIDGRVVRLEDIVLSDLKYGSGKTSGAISPWISGSLLGPPRGGPTSRTHSRTTLGGALRRPRSLVEFCEERIMRMKNGGVP